MNINVFTDGGARGNPGPAASAFVAIQSDQVIHSKGQFIATSTNNIAEYTAVIISLEWLTSYLNSQPQISSVNYYLDSLLVVNQIKGIYKVKDVKLIPLHQQIVHTLSTLPVKIIFSHIPRNQNHLADKLVNETIDLALLSK